MLSEEEYLDILNEVNRLRADLSRQYELNTHLVNENERQSAALEKAREALYEAQNHNTELIKMLYDTIE